ncbi:hypothetical protein VUR80DRAFT_911 [Thermomyces stellatus]
MRLMGGKKGGRKWERMDMDCDWGRDFSAPRSGPRSGNARREANGDDASGTNASSSPRDTNVYGANDDRRRSSDGEGEVAGPSSFSVFNGGGMGGLDNDGRRNGEDEVATAGTSASNEHSNSNAGRHRGVINDNEIAGKTKDEAWLLVRVRLLAPVTTILT